MLRNCSQLQPVRKVEERGNGNCTKWVSRGLLRALTVTSAPVTWIRVPPTVPKERRTDALPELLSRHYEPKRCRWFPVSLSTSRCRPMAARWRPCSGGDSNRLASIFFFLPGTPPVRILPGAHLSASSCLSGGKVGAEWSSQAPSFVAPHLQTQSNWRAIPILVVRSCPLISE